MIQLPKEIQGRIEKWLDETFGGINYSPIYEIKAHVRASCVFMYNLLVGELGYVNPTESEYTKLLLNHTILQGKSESLESELTAAKAEIERLKKTPQSVTILGDYHLPTVTDEVKKLREDVNRLMGAQGQSASPA